MYNNDSDFIFESYKDMYDEGYGFSPDAPEGVKLNPGRHEQLGKKTYGEITEEDVDRILSTLKANLRNYEGAQMGTFDDIKLEIKAIIIDELEGRVNATKAGYASRVIANELKEMGVVVEIEDGSDEVVIKDVDKIDAVEDELEDVLDVETEPVKQTFKLDGTYEVTGSPEGVLSPSARKVLAQMLDVGDDIVGREFVKRVDDWYDDIDGLKVAIELFNAKAIIPAQAEVGDEDRVVDVGDEDDSGHEDVVAGEFEKLRRNIAGGESPVMRPDDF